MQTYKKSMKNQCKIDTQKHRKIDANMAPKSMKIAPKMALEPTLGHSLSIFWPFGAMQKKTWIFDAFLEDQKSEKSDQGAAKRLEIVSAGSPKNGFFGIWVPGAARARPESWYKESWKLKKRELEKKKVEKGKFQMI